MRSPTALALSAAVLSLSFADIPAPPAVDPDGVWTAALVPPSLPAGAISPGARIVIDGVRLGPDRAVMADEAAPPATLAGVSVRIVQGSTTLSAGLFSVSARRIEAWIPDSLTTGPARLTVTHDGRESEPYKLDLQPSFSFLPADPRPQAAPGETVRLRGSGSAADLDVFVGGVSAGRASMAGDEACCKGVRTLAFEVPRNAPQGCYVPVVARSRSRGRPTNFTAIAVHPSGEPCRDRIDWFRQSVEGAQNAGFAVLARVSLLFRSEEYVFDYGLASFGRQESGKRPFPPFPPPGSCAGFTERMNLRDAITQSRHAGAWPDVVKPAPGNRNLDAGLVEFRGAKGDVRSLPRPGIIGGREPFSHAAPLTLFASPGRYTVSSPGGVDIGAFSAPIDVPRTLVWRNRARVREVDRAAGVGVEWTPSRKQDAVLIVAASADDFTGDSAMAVCMAPAAAGKFTIPPLALANLPPGDPRKPDYGYLVLLEVPQAPPSPIRASGLDSAFAAFLSASARNVLYR